MVWRMENSPDHGYEDNQAPPFRRLQRRDRGSINPLRHGVTGHSRQYDTHDRGSHNGRRCNETTVSCKMGSCKENRLRLGPDNTGSRGDGTTPLLSHIPCRLEIESRPDVLESKRKSI